MKRCAAFTLVELLTVLAIISILSSMIFPTFARAREGARRTSCSSNLRQIGLVITLYIEDYDERYPLMENVVPVKAEEPVPAGCPATVPLQVTWESPLKTYTQSDAVFVCPSVGEPAKAPADNESAIPLWDDCSHSIGGGKGGGGKTCPKPQSIVVPRPTYAFNSMINHAWAWQHTADLKIGQGFEQTHLVTTNCAVPPSAPNTTSGRLSDLLDAHAAQVAQPSATILMADAESRDGKAPETVNFTNDLELDFPTTAPTGDEKLAPNVFLSRRHLGGYNALFADGHIKFVRYGSSQPKQWTVEED